MAYLVKHATSYFKAREMDGESLWQSLGPKADFIIAHPNGWGAHEQGVLRDAAVAGGLVSAIESHQRVHFVSEAEASVHFVIFHSELGSRINVSVYGDIVI